MDRNPKDPLKKEQVITILTRLLRIEQGNPDQDSEIKIASDYQVERKTITRIRTGATWKQLHCQFFKEIAPTVALLQKLGPMPPVDEQLQDLISFVADGKTKYLLSHEKPLHFGRYDWIDGVHVVVSDGIITWEQQHLYELALRMKASGIPGHPLFSDSAKEMPTFSLSRMMTRPIGAPLLHPEELGNGISRLKHKEEMIFLADRYIRLATRLDLDIRLAGDRYDFVYLTKTEKAETRDREPVITVFAALATLELE